jgi:[NiFe] hydrogenase diaphorase moiety large subunit
MMDIVRDVQAELGSVSNEMMDQIAKAVSSHRVEVESVVSFYAFLSSRPKGKVVIRLCNDIIDTLSGVAEVACALSKELGIEFGETTADGVFSLEYTPCIGMCDQAPAALVNDTVVTCLTPESAKLMIKELRDHRDPKKLVKRCGDGNNSHDLVQSMVDNNIREKGEVIFDTLAPGTAIKNALAMTPAEVIRAVKTARLRGRGGAGFPTGMKWEFTRAAAGADKTIICNADEGEPGTFKDRVILTECPDLLIEGMTVGAYAIGAQTGIIYLRGEYAYLRSLIEDVLAKRRSAGLLGRNICGKEGFDFDIRIQMGAGAYICGEETALISSCEGLRGDPKNRPPFPAQRGYQGQPTSVNNVETLCSAAKILEKGAGWFAKLGNGKSTGTKLLSVSGDCRKPGVYEVPFGITIRELLGKVDAKDVAAVQVGGPSGTMISPTEFDRTVCFEDLATGGSVMVFSSQRNILQVVHAFLEFFVEESCGYCTPCRVGNVLLKECVERIMAGKGEASDLPYLEELGKTIKATSRCGLGQTSSNPVLTTLQRFRSDYEKLLKPSSAEGQQAGFDLSQAVKIAEDIIGRKSAHC